MLVRKPSWRCPFHRYPRFALNDEGYDFHSFSQFAFIRRGLKWLMLFKVTIPPWANILRDTVY